jgi:dipeptidyl aminopeptidase/acylaminoacyl peptidase
MKIPTMVVVSIASLWLLVILSYRALGWWNSDKKAVQPNQAIQVEEQLHPLAIESLRKGKYPGSDLIVEETLANGRNYKRYIVSYQSEGNKNYALLTVPTSPMPVGGYPAIVFNHGFIPPKEYKTTERYIAYVDGFAGNGYIVLRPDYRGHGNSEGIASGAYGSNDYTVDVLNAVSSLKKRSDVNAGKIGMWGHSMGGFITLRVMVTIPDIKAGVIWGGVVGSYDDLLNNWRRRQANITPFPSQSASRGWRQLMSEQFGSPDKNPQFWNSISATSFLGDISGPLEIHHSDTDETVPVLFSRKLQERMQSAGKESTLFEYKGDDHNIAANFSLAMNRSIAFFDKHLKP